MSAHYKWYPSEAEVIVPWNARYSFPSQANKAVKMTPRIPPKNGGTFNPGQVIRLEFPAQGYVNPNNTTLSFDATLVYGYAVDADTTSQVRFQNNIQSLFSRVRLMYGATPLEDIIGYGQIVRSLTEWAGNAPDGVITQSSIHEGIGSYVNGVSGLINGANPTGAARSSRVQGLVNVRQAMIQGVSTIYSVATGVYPDPPNGQGFGVVPAGTIPNVPAAPASAPYITTANPVRRYQVQFALGLFNQEKLIPTKFMASQLAIEITLANAAECIFIQPNSYVTSASYQISNVNLIPEILEFDASYDEMFLKGLMDRGVPIKFSTWNNYKFGVSGGTANLQIQERSRSVKSIFALQRRDPPTFGTDTGASFFNTATNVTDGLISLQEYQYRIGGRYFPAAPVQNATTVGGNTSNGGAESWIELQKALNYVGDNRLAVPCNVLKWAVNATVNSPTNSFAGATLLMEYDYNYMYVGMRNGSMYATGISSTVNALSGNVGSSCFVMAIDLETSNGGEISGLNAEEQSDISLIARWSAAQNTSFVFDVYTYIDSMIVLKENNVIELIQ